ncbi:MAG: PorV/PorQ family protein [Bacteroidetes bacterium]|nr:PorV/PorQ family protein [Bacteroidota bacterium]
MKKLYGFGLAVALCVGACTSTLIAQDNSGNVNSAPRDFSKIGAGLGNFLNIPVGARAIGMGASFTGVADDPTALYWNPAGIMQGKGASANYSFASLFAGITHNFAGVTIPIGESYKAGVSAVSYGSDDIPVTTLFQQDGTGERYQVRDLALGLTFAGQLTEQFSFGITGKFVNLAFATESASGVAFDVGTLYKPGILGLRLGFAVQNLSTPMKYTGNGLVQTGGFNQTTGYQNPDVQLEATEASLPLTFRAGLAADVLEGDEMQKLLVSTEFSTASDRGEFASLGAEYTWNNLLSARAGYQFGSSEAYGISAGLGIRYQTGGFLGQIDYAIRPHKTLGLVNQISASVWFN